MSDCIVLINPYLEFIRNILLIVVSFLAIVTFWRKRRTLFGNKLQEKQIELLTKLRDEVTTLSLEIHYIFNSAKTFTEFGGSLSRFKEYDEETFERYTKVKDQILNLYYMGQDSKAYYIPKKFNFEIFKRLSEYLKNKKLNYFSVFALQDKKTEDIEDLSKEILILRDYVDSFLKKHL